MAVGTRRFGIFATLLLSVTTIFNASAQSTLSRATVPDRSVRVSVAGTPVGEEDLGRLVDADYRVVDEHLIIFIEKAPQEMPSASPGFYFAGKDSATRVESVWTAKPPVRSNAPSQSSAFFEDEFTALSLAAIDGGYIGDPWASLWRRVPSDDASRLLFGKDIGHAFEEASDRRKAIAEADANWIRLNVLIGMVRRNAYSALRSYGLVAYNPSYIRGVPFGSGGCNYSDTSSGDWPYAGEAIPAQTGACAHMHAMPGVEAEAFPSARIVLASAFNFACGSRIDVLLTFDDRDSIKAVSISEPLWECL